MQLLQINDDIYIDPTQVKVLLVTTNKYRYAVEIFIKRQFTFYIYPKEDTRERAIELMNEIAEKIHKSQTPTG